MIVTKADIAAFKAAFYNNQGDDADDPVEIALTALFAMKQKQQALVAVTPDCKINPHDISALEWDRRFYINGSSRTLVIVMKDGRKYHVEHTAWVNAYDIERSILMAMGGTA